MEGEMKTQPITTAEIKHVLNIAHDAQNIRISNNGNSFEWDEPQAPGVVFSTQRIWRE
jgi:hypothetical protein